MRLILTDLDGTLIDHHTYSADAARPALTMARGQGVPIVLCSSKTLAEMRVLASRLELSPAPLIVVTETAPKTDRAAGVDISMADLMADGSELAGVAPRTATSGIGSDVELDLFSDGVPLNAPNAPAPENDPRDFLY